MPVKKRAARKPLGRKAVKARMERKTAPVRGGNWRKHAEGALALARKHKALSVLAPQLMRMHPKTAPYADKIGEIGVMLGMGRGRYSSARPMLGDGKVWDAIKSGFRKFGQSMKETKLGSKLAMPLVSALTGNPALGAAAASAIGLAGYGRKPRMVRGRGMPMGQGNKASLPAGSLVPFVPSLQQGSSRARF